VRWSPRKDYYCCKGAICHLLLCTNFITRVWESPHILLFICSALIATKLLIIVMIPTVKTNKIFSLRGNVNWMLLTAHINHYFDKHFYILYNYIKLPNLTELEMANNFTKTICFCIFSFLPELAIITLWTKCIELWIWHQ